MKRLSKSTKMEEGKESKPKQVISDRKTTPVNFKGITAYDTFSMSFMFHTPKFSVKIGEKKIHPALVPETGQIQFPLKTTSKRSEGLYTVETSKDNRFLGYVTNIVGPYDEEEMDQYDNIKDALQGHRHYCYHVKRLGDDWESYMPYNW